MESLIKPLPCKQTARTWRELNSSSSGVFGSYALIEDYIQRPVDKVLRSENPMCDELDKEDESFITSIKQCPTPDDNDFDYPF